jgi:hypothetical protein
MKCPNCGHDNRDDTPVCRRCDLKFETSVEKKNDALISPGSAALIALTLGAAVIGRCVFRAHADRNKTATHNGSGCGNGPSEEMIDDEHAIPVGEEQAYKANDPDKTSYAQAVCTGESKAEINTVPDKPKKKGAEKHTLMRSHISD